MSEKNEKKEKSVTSKLIELLREEGVAKFNDGITSIQWDEIAFANGMRSHRVALPEATCGARLEKLNALVRDETEFSAFFRALKAY